MTQDHAGDTSPPDFIWQRRRELIAFLILAFGIWPIVAVGVVGGFGFAVWVWQIIFGPPGPPPGGLH